MRFTHRIVYIGWESVEQSRCRDCGNKPNIEWTPGMSSSGNITVMYPTIVTCPNGPHQITEEQYKEQIAETAAEMEEALNNVKKRGWLK